MSSGSSMKNAKNVNVQTCHYVWAVQYRLFRSGEMLLSPEFFAKNNIKWRMKLLPLQGLRNVDFYEYEDDHDVIYNKVELQLVVASTSTNEIKNHGAYGGEVAFCFKSKIPTMQEITCKGPFVVKEDVRKSSIHDGRYVYKTTLRKDELFNSDFTVRCEVTFFKLFAAIPLFVSHFRGNTGLSEIFASNPLEDFAKLYLNRDQSDITICIKSKGTESKEYPAHKLVLTVRSKVFEAMFKHDMKEKKLNRVVVEEIKEEVFLEALRYIYTGEVRNLNTFAYELLPVAERYDLEKLKITCGNVILENLSVETAAKMLTLADTYNMDDLKKEAIQFIKNNSSDVIQKMNSEGWEDLMSRPHLMKDILIANTTSYRDDGW